MASLAVQSLKHLSLEQILDIGFDSLPHTEEFFRGLIDKLDRDHNEYYDHVCDWSQFEKDLLFIVNNERKPLNYKGFAFYWRRVEQEYILVSGEAISYIHYFEDFESLMNEIFTSILLNYGRLDEGVIKDSFTIPSDVRPILEMMYSQKEKEVLELKNKVDSAYLEITLPLMTLPIFPLTKTKTAMALFDDDDLIIVGAMIRKKEYREKLNKGYAIKVPAKDVHLILAILAYNEDSYEL